MKPNQVSVETVTKLVADISKGKIDDALTAFDTEAKWRCGEALPEAGTYEGKDGIRKLFAKVRERYRNEPHYLQLTVNASDGQVFAEYTRSGSSDAYAPGSEHVLAVFEVVMGKIREAREFVFRRS